LFAMARVAITLACLMLLSCHRGAPPQAIAEPVPAPTPLADVELKILRIKRTDFCFHLRLLNSGTTVSVPEPYLYDLPYAIKVTDLDSGESYTWLENPGVRINPDLSPPNIRLPAGEPVIRTSCIGERLLLVRESDYERRPRPGERLLWSIDTTLYDSAVYGVAARPVARVRGQGVAVIEW
jgi:hypothetical protein